MVVLRNNNQNPEPPACRLVSFYYPTGFIVETIIVIDIA
jgi:hypothetical protein